VGAVETVGTVQGMYNMYGTCPRSQRAEIELSGGGSVGSGPPLRPLPIRSGIGSIPRATQIMLRILHLCVRLCLSTSPDAQGANGLRKAPVRPPQAPCKFEEQKAFHTRIVARNAVDKFRG
jgi:hypothetical protein